MRPLKFAKYLPQFGWKPTILTVDGGDAFCFDETLLQELPSEASIVRVPSLEILKTTQAKGFSDRLKGKKNRGLSGRYRRGLARLLRWVYFSFFIPDEKVGWLIPAVRRISRIRQHHDFRLILATSPPQTNLLVGTHVQRHLQVPLVLDYRDEWTTNPHKHLPNAITRFLHRRLETSVVRKSDMLLVMSNGVKHNLREAKILTRASSSRCVVLPNGFDPADYVDPTSSTSTRFSIVHTGSFYGELRVPDPFLHALGAWLSASPQIKDDVRVLFQGSIYPQHRRLVDQLGLREVVHIGGIVPHRQAIIAQQRASLLLLIMGKGEGTAILPGKVFEYLGARRPILAIVHPQGESADLIRRTNTGIVVDPDDTGAIVEALNDFYVQWRTGNLSYSPRDGEVRRYSRVEQAHRLSDLFEQLI